MQKLTLKSRGPVLGWGLEATPFDLVWHVNTAMERLLLHVWAALVFGLGCVFSGSTEIDTGRGTV